MYRSFFKATVNLVVRLVQDDGSTRSTDIYLLLKQNMDSIVTCSHDPRKQARIVLCSQHDGGERESENQESSAPPPAEEEEEDRRSNNITSTPFIKKNQQHTPHALFCNDMPGPTSRSGVLALAMGIKKDKTKRRAGVSSVLVLSSRRRRYDHHQHHH